jgi:PKHD-type hydroxylase
MKHTFMVFENAVSTELCNQAINRFAKEDFKAGLVGGHGVGQFDGQTRNSDIQWANKYDVLECILTRFIMQANQEALWDFDITSPELVQIGKYKPDQFYGQHMDCFVKGSDVISTGNGNAVIVPMLSQRKISASLLLNDESEYEGGDLKILDETVKTKKQGSIIVFPSFMAHQVTPVTKGVRYSAVCWMAGPKWK